MLHFPILCYTTVSAGQVIYPSTYSHNKGLSHSWSPLTFSHNKGLLTQGSLYQHTNLMVLIVFHVYTTCWEKNVTWLAANQPYSRCHIPNKGQEVLISAQLTSSQYSLREHLHWYWYLGQATGSSSASFQWQTVNPNNAWPKSSGYPFGPSSQLFPGP